MSQPVGLIIAGLDPSGGAGVIVDVKTLAGFDCFPTAAITSLTYQNSEGLNGASHQTAESLRAQIEPVIKEYRVAAVKVGMLPTRELVLEMARLLRETNLPAPVIDPILRSSSGYQLMEDDAIPALLNEFIPLARLLTPNIPEAEELAGLKITNEGEMIAAARKIRQMGARAVLIKGGHLYQGSEVRGQGSERFREAIDVLDDEARVTVFRGEWIKAPPVRGTGCMLSTAIAACLAQQIQLEAAVRRAKEFVAEAIRYFPNTSV
jgi:hydroxymethylpyrimidine/phosphomethylpyrimidine kinase